MKIICLAKSKKNKGYCVAGKYITDDNKVSQWVRPVNNDENSCLSSRDCHLKSGGEVKVGDIIDFTPKGIVPHKYQCENVANDPNYHWVKHNININHQDLLDNPESIWENGYSTKHGENDFIPVNLLDKNHGSLLYIKPRSLHISIDDHGYGRKVRGHFMYNNTLYRLMVTCPSTERLALTLSNGYYPAKEVFKTEVENNMYVVISLSEEFHGNSYKLLASFNYIEGY